ncbi:hypothetical protein [Solimonas marina]|uniref:hypothetical protein n=1 Tax=Solimonas marina TaxID=2714601 RepID=UPI00143B4509|nr:hypothetical protein [Solimonas marina]
MNRKEYTAVLIEHFTGFVLDGVVAKDTAVLANLTHCQCEVDLESTPPVIRFSLSNLFNAVWRHGRAVGLDLPRDSNWGKDFAQFCRSLMYPWPNESFERRGYRLYVLHRSSSHVKCRYELSVTG